MTGAGLCCSKLSLLPPCPRLFFKYFQSALARHAPLFSVQRVPTSLPLALLLHGPPRQSARSSAGASLALPHGEYDCLSLWQWLAALLCCTFCRHAGSLSQAQAPMTFSNCCRGRRSNAGKSMDTLSLRVVCCPLRHMPTASMSRSMHHLNAFPLFDKVSDRMPEFHFCMQRSTASKAY